jgi:hypothetical protein
MTDAQMLQNLLSVYETMVIVNLQHTYTIVGPWMPAMREVIAELRRRIALGESK